ncbi:MAG TPA: DnaJ domain-containing protein, partial [Kiloniellales bacterium]|nr:DnaJ domain-containing protein [Kiloniellales bacterium]
PVLLLILAILIGIALIAWWFSHAQPAQILGGLRVAITVLAVLVLAWLLIFRLYFAAAVVPLIGLALWRLAPNLLGRMRAAAQGRRYGRQSGVRTRWLAMTLDHATGEAEGEVLQGRFAGRRLIDLTLSELLALRGELTGDAQSLALLEAWLDRRHADWRNLQAAGEGRGGRLPMTREQAYAVLGLAPGASAEEIKQAHRRLMQKLHPDHGGSDWLAAELNEAKDLLLHSAG